MEIHGFYMGHIKNSENLEIEPLIRAHEPEISEITKLDVNEVTPVLPLHSEFFLCSICNQKLDQCNHAVGGEYNTEICKAIPDGYENLGIRMNECTPLKYRVTDLVVFKNERNSTITTWYGFPTHIERLHRIDILNQIGHITKLASDHFRQFFTENLTGISEFVEKKN